MRRKSRCIFELNPKSNYIFLRGGFLRKASSFDWVACYNLSKVNLFYIAVAKSCKIYIESMSFLLLKYG